MSNRQFFANGKVRIAKTKLALPSTNRHQIPVVAKSLIYTDTQHPESYARIQEIEAPRPLPEEVPEPEKQVRLCHSLPMD